MTQTVAYSNMACTCAETLDSINNGCMQDKCQLDILHWPNRFHRSAIKPVQYRPKPVNILSKQGIRGWQAIPAAVHGRRQAQATCHNSKLALVLGGRGGKGWSGRGGDRHAHSFAPAHMACYTPHKPLLLHHYHCCCCCCHLTQQYVSKQRCKLVSSNMHPADESVPCWPR